MKPMASQFFWVIACAISSVTGLMAPLSSYAAGAATHITIGEVAAGRLSTGHSEITNLIKEYHEAFYAGTVWPDAVQSYWKEHDGDRGGYSNDALSHGLRLGSSSAAERSAGQDGGYLKEYLLYAAQMCQLSLETEHARHSCNEHMAFFWGVLNHYVGDGLWHQDWIGIQDNMGYDGLNSQAAGTQSLANHCNNLATDDRHHLSDTDIDICMGYVLGGGTKPMHTVFDMKTANKTNGKFQFLCPSGQFLDLVETGGTCWSCPKDHGRAVGTSIKSNKACLRGAYYANKNATKKSKGTGALGLNCPSGSGQRLATNGYCYACPSGYGFSAAGLVAPNMKNACTKYVPDSYKSATEYGSAGICPNGQFPDVGLKACYSCPSGYTYFPQYMVGDERVCQKVGEVACNKINLNNLKGATMGVARNAALAATATTNLSDSIGSMSQAFSGKGLPKPASKDVQDKITNYMKYAAAGNLIGFSDTFWPEKQWIVDNFGLNEDKDKVNARGTFTKHASECDWAYQNVTSANTQGNILAAAEGVAAFLAAVYDALPPTLQYRAFHIGDSNEKNINFEDVLAPINVVRFNDYNYGLQVNGAWVHCVKDCPTGP